MTAIVIKLLSGATWMVPADWNSSNNTIDCIGAGGSGSNGGNAGGGGGFSRNTNMALTRGATMTINVPGSTAGAAQSTSTLAGGVAGGDAWISTTGSAPTTTAQGVLAKGGAGAIIPTPTSNYLPAAGGASASGIGNTKFSGGQGAAAVQWSNFGDGGGGGGGGAAGPNGAGAAGSSVTGGPNFVGGAGGKGDNTSGGAGGAGGTGSAVPGSAGSPGTEYSITAGGTAGSGGGGGGGFDNVGTPASSAAGNGGTYGAGGGGGGNDTFTARKGGDGAQGVIIITYTPGGVTPSLTAAVAAYVLAGLTSTSKVGKGFLAVVGAFLVTASSAQLLAPPVNFLRLRVVDPVLQLLRQAPPTLDE